MKRQIRLNESDLHRIVKESVKRILREHTWGETPNIEDNELPEEEIIKQGRNYVLKKGWYLGDGKNDRRGVTDYRCDIFLTPQQIKAFNDYVSQAQESYINSNGHQYTQGDTYYDTYEDTELGLTKIQYGDLLDPHDDKNGIKIILDNFTDTTIFEMPDMDNIRYYISKA